MERISRGDGNNVRILKNTTSIMKEQNDTNTPATTPKRLHFKIEKQKESPNDYWYRARPYIGNMNMLGNRYLGLYPENILNMLKKNKFFKSGRLLFGLCLCGCEGCDDFCVDIVVNDDTVIWKGWHEFSKAEYISALREVKEAAAACLAKHKKGLKAYKKAVYECLMQDMGIPETDARNKMEFYEEWNFIEQYFMKDYSVALAAKAIVLGEEEDYEI